MRSIGPHLRNVKGAAKVAAKPKAAPSEKTPQPGPKGAAKAKAKPKGKKQPKGQNAKNAVPAANTRKRKSEDGAADDA